MKTKIAAVLSSLCLVGCFQPIDELSDANKGGQGGLQGGQGGAGGSSNNLGPSACNGFTFSGTEVQPAQICICTRRDAVPNGSCAKGANETASATIGAAGGTLTLMGQQGKASGVAFSIEFPPGAIATDTLITVTETSIPPPAGMVDWSPVFRVEPAELVLAAPAKLRVPWSQGRGQSYGGPQLFWSTDSSTCTLEKLPSSYVNAGFNQANVGRLGYAISGYPNLGSATFCN